MSAMERAIGSFLNERKSLLFVCSKEINKNISFIQKTKITKFLFG